MKKRIIPLLLTLCFLLSLVPASAMAAEVTASGTCGENLTWELTSDGTLTISGTGEMKFDSPANPPDAPWASYSSQIRRVEIGEGVTSIAVRAFIRCSNLSEVSIADSVISIDSASFAYCDSLTSLTIPGGVSYLSPAAIDLCNNLSSIQVDPDNATYEADADSVLYNKVTKELVLAPRTISGNYAIAEGTLSIGENAFQRCSGLTHITIPVGLTHIGRSAFSVCAALVDVTLPDGLIKIGDSAFAECSALTQIEIPDSVTDIGSSAFIACSSLVSVKLPQYITELKSNTFTQCSSLTEILIPEGVVVIDRSSFLNCTQLAHVTIPETVTTLGWSCFTACENLTEVFLPKNVSSIGDDAFANCTSLTKIEVDKNNTLYSNDSYGALLNKEQTVLIQVPGGLTGSYTIPASVTKIGISALSGCTQLTELIIPEGVEIIQAQAFEGCSSLTKITIPASVTEICNTVFSYCDSLKDVIFTGDCPNIYSQAFWGTSATCYYPAHNETWTPKALQNYSGKLSWIPYIVNPFTDVGDGNQFKDYILWGYYNGIINGKTATTFEPENTVTRGQFILMLWRAAGKPEPTQYKAFPDVSENSSFYKAVCWAVEMGITNGKKDGNFGVNDPCTRGHVALFLYRFAGDPEIQGTSSFPDVTGGTYYKAVCWAAENGITSGQSDGNFGVSNPCKRMHVMKFLYLFLNEA